MRRDFSEEVEGALFGIVIAGFNLLWFPVVLGNGRMPAIPHSNFGKYLVAFTAAYLARGFWRMKNGLPPFFDER